MSCYLTTYCQCERLHVIISALIVIVSCHGHRCWKCEIQLCTLLTHVCYCRWCWVLSLLSLWRSPTSMRGQDAVALTLSHEQPGKTHTHMHTHASTCSHRQKKTSTILCPVIFCHFKYTASVSFLISISLFLTWRQKSSWLLVLTLGINLFEKENCCLTLFFQLFLTTIIFHLFKHMWLKQGAI